jgi:uncharacterized membrane protein YgcG
MGEMAMTVVRILVVAATGLIVSCAQLTTTPPAAPGASQATAASAQPSPQTSPAPSSETKTFSQAELDQLAAPIALYPDALLAQVLIASTYPIEVVNADRWIAANPGLKGTALENALQSQSWDPAVKSLTVFPQVLQMMSQKLDWTQKLGDAFLAQPKDVMATVQALRAKALAEGTLKDSKEQKVIVVTENNVTIIKIEPADPEVVYVPTYDPSIVYGAWAYPAYPPYYWYPPGYHYPGGAFLAGIIVGWALWGDCNWGNGGVYVDHRKYNNFNRTNISGDNNWRHNVNHRGGVPYRDQRVAQQYGRGPAGDATSREAFRGRADASPQSGQRSPTAFDTNSGARTRDSSSRGSSSMGAARGAGNFGGGRMGGGGRGGGRR